MSIKLCSLLHKGYIREKKFLRVLSLLCCVSMTLLLVFNYFTEVSSVILEKSIESDCGKYDIMIGNVQKGDITKIKKMENVVSYHEYLEEEVYYEDMIYYFVYSDSKYLEYSSFSYVDGRFPENDNEIMCEPWLLRQIGISSENMIGSTVDIAGKQYTVTGLFVNKAYSISEESSATILCNDKADINMVMIEMDGDVTDAVIEKLLSEMSSNKDIVIGRNFDKETADTEARESAYTTRIFVLFILLLSVILMLGNCINLFISHIRKNVNIYLGLGIEKKQIAVSLFGAIAFMIVLCNIIGTILYIILSRGIYNLSFSENEIRYDYMLSDVISGNTIKLFLLICLAELITLLIIVYGIFNSKEYRRTGKIGKVYDIKPRTNKSNKLFLAMAKNNLKMSSKNSLIMLIAITFSISAFICTYYYIDTLTNTGIDYGDTKFIITFKDESLLSGEQIKQKEKIIDELFLDKSLKAATQNVFYTTGQIEKNIISDEFASYLRMYVDYNAAFDNNLIDIVPISFGVISETQMRRYMNISVEENEAVLYNCPTNLEIKSSLAIEKDTLIQLMDFKGTKKDIIIKDIKEACPFTVYTETVALILVVDDKMFDELSNTERPDIVYISGDVDEAKLFDYIRNTNFAQIENIEFDKLTVDMAVDKIKFILEMLLLVCIVSLAITLTTACNIRVLIFKNEYSTLDAIGIPLKNIIRVPVYEFILMTIPILISSFAGSYAVTKVIHMMIASEYKIIYSFPTGVFIIVLILLLLVEGICSLSIAWLMRRKICTSID